MSNRAWVTLATNDSYGLGALVLAHSLRRVGSTYPAVILITPSVTDAMRDRLRAIFAEVITVDVLDSQDATHLALLQRPELGITFTKIHCWNLTQYDRCVFLDADILVVQNCDELFEREELSAAPDVGWPDCFNSGVFVFQPSADTFSRLITFAQERGSFDGGDQGLLNSFFSSWSTDNNKRLPFLYNVTSAAFYSYLPALKQYGQNLKIIHFIGPAKPWLQNYNFESQSVDAPEHLKGFLQLWWDLFTSQVHTQLDVSMAHFEEPSPEGHFDSETVDHAPWIDNQTSFDHHDHHNHHEHHDHHYEEDHKDHNIFSIEEPQNNHFKHEHNTYSYNKVEIQKPPAYPINQNKSKHAYCIHMDYEKPCMKRGKHKYNEGINGDVIYVDEIYDDVTPRHPYDGFYLRHRATIDSRGRKICTHQITLRSPSPPPESFEENNNAVESLENGFLSEEEDETGVAGNLARVQPGTPLQREAIDELARRQGWESGNIDYMGADSFANIWAKISQTLNEGPSSPPKQPSPPKESPPVSEEPAKEVAEELAEKVAEATLSDIPDIPVPAREAINAAGKMSDTSSTITIPQIAPDASIAEADTKTETSTAPNETVVAAEICQSLDAIPSETSKGETTLESVASKEDVAETSAIPVSSPVLHEKQPLEPASSETKDAHEVEQMHENDIPKTDSVSEKPVDVHAAEPVAENPIESSPPQLIEAVSVKSPELALESPVAAPQEDIVPTVISDVHESKPSQEASESSKVECAVVAPESKPAPESESIPTVVHESKPAQEPSDASKVACAAEATEAKPTPESESIPSVVHEPKPAQEPSDSSKVECLKKAPESKPASETESIPSVVHESIPTPEADVPKIEAINPIASIPTETPSLEVQEPSVPDADIKKPVAPPSETPKPESISAPSEPKQDKTPVKTDAPASDSPPLANTPSQEEIPSVTAAKLEERRKPAGKLQLSPPSVADPLPTPDSELEDAASLAQSIIASELRTPTVTSPSPPAGLASPQLQAQPERLDVRKPDVPTPPVGAVSLSQIGVKPKAKPTTASQIESSVSEKPETEAPKKKVVKKVVKKDAASSGEAPVPPPRKKEKKPKDK
ncbi:actin cytoskeleton-regulatory complex protein PAN1 isoform X7 [Colias croceus]|uniref:actin cytoskeleton-regulatory complex protein PAN1 isoform X7 n=1 Tax=Colias crocea TaxID=72248 RepID=UPI001E28109B|nr:actin cytoskeleton-regulatory complex protein PAN1 isoform X7 [Colias croceus]